jgi:DNA adenine methylase
MAAPFLKWAGGKAKLVPALLELLPREGPLAYHEPFVGAGAVFFGLEAERRLRSAALNDMNEELIGTYEAVRDRVDEVIAELASVSAEYLGRADQHSRAEHYYDVRAQRPTNPAARAARMVFLNRTCFNGLYRVNRKGEFNVPHGDYARPRILDADGLRACSAALAGAALSTLDFEEACLSAGAGELVYLDPPYQPLTPTANFTSYTSADFGEGEQRRLADVFRDLTRRGVRAILSNSAHPAVEALYRGYPMRRIPMARAINSDGSKRGPVEELVVTNFEAAGYAKSSPK